MTQDAPPLRPFDWYGLGTQFTGVVILLLYTIFTGWQLFVNRSVLKATRAALKQTRRSNRATETSNQIAERSLELGRRAWIVVSKIERPGMKAWPAVAQITLSNVGGVPAADIMVRTEFKIDPFPTPPIFGPQARQHPMGVLGNGCADSLTEMPANDASSYLFLRIEYRDYFDKPRWTEGVWRYDGSDLQWKADKHHRVDGNETGPGSN